MASSNLLRSGFGDFHRKRPVVPPRDVGRRRSGFVIVRLVPAVAPTRAEDLAAAAKECNLEGLSRLLEEYDLFTSRRVVRSLEPEEILGLERRAAQSDLPPLRSLTAYWRVDVRRRPRDVEAILARLRELPEVDAAYAELEASDPAPAVDDSDDPYADGQGYLDAAPDGIDARWAWTQTNGLGAGVAIVDLEQGWFPNHEDLSVHGPALIYGDNRDGEGTYKGNHGTAVLGEMVAEDNTAGVVGAAPGVTSVRMASHYDKATGTSGNVADAIVAAIPEMAIGDVLLLEVQKGFLPTETDDADFDAIRLAVALGVIVVEAAGNGASDLDAYTDGGGDAVLNRGDPAFRESGAIVVGAGLSAPPHDRAGFSNFGSRIDCYGWGEDVTTCGYGDLDDGGGDDDQSYTDTFGGTSSASPIVAGAALVVQGMHEANTGVRLSPGQMRPLLSDPATGTAQGPNVAGNIGVMPDLRAIIEDGLGLVPDVYVRDNVGDTGEVPVAGGVSASPDIIVRPAAVADGQAAFGEGSGTENSHTEGFEAEGGQDNFIYVRMRNRGSSDAAGVRATVYWSEVSTLVTPDSWNLIGTTAPIDVPQGDTLEVAPPLTWSKNDIPGTGHYCFVGLLDHAQDEAPPVPGPTDWEGFRSFIRNQNNVAWRNFNVVDELPDPSEPTSLSFVIAGAPDRGRVFDLEILRRLPKGAEVLLEVPLALARQLSRGRLWKLQVDAKQRLARIPLPAASRLAACDLKLAARARHPARFLVRAPRELRDQGRGFEGQGLAIRQLYEGQEVGRVSWVFHRRAREKC